MIWRRDLDEIIKNRKQRFAQCKDCKMVVVWNYGITINNDMFDIEGKNGK